MLPFILFPTTIPLWNVLFKMCSRSIFTTSQATLKNSRQMPSGLGALFDFPLEIAIHNSFIEIGSAKVSFISGSVLSGPHDVSCKLCTLDLIGSNFLRKCTAKAFRLDADVVLGSHRHLLSLLSVSFLDVSVL